MNVSVEEWSTAISTHEENGRVIIWRFPSRLRQTFRMSSQPDRVIIVWPYSSATGQPDSDEVQRMTLLEDALEPVLDSGRFGTLAMVSTGENRREWIYYVRSFDDFLAGLNDALAGQPEFPIEIHTAVDSDWTTYAEFTGGLTGTATPI